MPQYTSSPDQQPFLTKLLSLLSQTYTTHHSPHGNVAAPHPSPTTTASTKTLFLKLLSHGTFINVSWRFILDSLHGKVRFLPTSINSTFLWDADSYIKPRQSTNEDLKDLTIITTLALFDQPINVPQQYKEDFDEVVSGLLLKCLNDNKNNHSNSSNDNNSNTNTKTPNHASLKSSLLLTSLLTCIQSCSLPLSFTPLKPLLFTLSLTPSPPPSDPLPTCLQTLQTVMQTPTITLTTSTTLLKNPSPSHLPPHSTLYLVTLPDGAVVRDGYDIDTAVRLKVLKKGTVVNVVNMKDVDGVKRLKIVLDEHSTFSDNVPGTPPPVSYGWISERLRGGSSDLVVERLTKSLSEDLTNSHISGSLPEIIKWPVATDEENGRIRVRHFLHCHCLRYTQPISLFPRSPGWSCDNCGVEDVPSTRAGWVCGEGCNWVICGRCFEGDGGAVEGWGGGEGGRREREREEERGRREEERGRITESVEDLTLMGFPEQTATEAVNEAIRILGIPDLGSGNEARIQPRRSIVEMAVGFVTGGEVAVREAEAEAEAERHREERRRRTRQMQREEEEEAMRRRERESPSRPPTGRPAFPPALGDPGAPFDTSAAQLVDEDELRTLIEAHEMTLREDLVEHSSESRISLNPPSYSPPTSRTERIASESTVDTVDTDELRAMIRAHEEGTRLVDPTTRRSDADEMREIIREHEERGPRDEDDHAWVQEVSISDTFFGGPRTPAEDEGEEFGFEDEEEDDDDDEEDPTEGAVREILTETMDRLPSPPRSQVTASTPLIRRTSPVRTMQVGPTGSLTDMLERERNEMMQNLEIDEELERELEAERRELIVEQTASDVAEVGRADRASSGEIVNDSDLPGSPFIIRPANDPPEPPPMNLTSDPRPLEIEDEEIEELYNSSTTSRGSKKSRKGRDASKKKSKKSSGPPTLKISDVERKKIARQLSIKCQFKVELCEHAMKNAGDDVKAAEEWLYNLGWSKEYLLYKTDSITTYSAVYTSLNFSLSSSSSVENGNNGETSREIAESLCSTLFESMEEDAESGTYKGEFISIEKEKEKKIDGGTDKSSASEGEGIFTEKVLKSIEVEKTSALHKSVCVILCPSCCYLEFPGCGQHKTLLSVKKTNGHGKCSKCSTATDTSGPWDAGCRQCKNITRKIFWSLSVREAQYLLKAFPSKARKSKDDSVKVKVLSCPYCNVVGFAGIGGENPRLAEVKDGVDFSLGQNCYIKQEVFEERLEHIGSCPNEGGELEATEVQISFGEAKYLYKSISAVTTLSTFKSNSGPLALNTQLALSSSAGCKRSPVIGKLTEILDGSIAVSVLNEETGLEMPTFVELKDAKFVTHTAGFGLTSNAREGVNNMFSAAIECHESESVRTARRIVVKLLESVEEEEDVGKYFGCDMEEFVRLIKLVIDAGGEEANAVKEFLRRVL